MRLVQGPMPGRFKTQWSTTSNRFRDVPQDTPESAEWVDSPQDPRRHGGGMPDRRAHLTPAERYGVQPGALDRTRAAEALAGVHSSRPIPVLYNDEDLPLAQLVASVLAERGQLTLLSLPDPRRRWSELQDAEWRLKFEPLLRSAEFVIDAQRPGSVPAGGKAEELRICEEAGVPVGTFVMALQGR